MHQLQSAVAVAAMLCVAEVAHNAPAAVDTTNMLQYQKHCHGRAISILTCSGGVGSSVSTAEARGCNSSGHSGLHTPVQAEAAAHSLQMQICKL
jgi:hypothetical protein